MYKLRCHTPIDFTLILCDQFVSLFAVSTNMQESLHLQTLLLWEPTSKQGTLFSYAFYLWRTVTKKHIKA